MIVRRRFYATVLSFAAISWSAESAFAIDSLWDLLRKADPAPVVVTKVVPAPVAPSGLPPASVNAVTGVPPRSLWDALRSDSAGTGGLTLTGVGPNLIGQNVPQQPAIETKTASRKNRGGILGIFDGIGNTLRRVGKALNTDIHVTGQKYIGLHMEKVDGSTETYSNDRYYGQRGIGGTYDNTDLTINGKVFGVVNFETRYSNYAYG